MNTPTPKTKTRCEAITDIIASVAMEQAALSNIIDAEAEKIQRIVEHARYSGEMLAVNKSVRAMVNAITRLEMVLQGKLELFEDCLCTQCDEE